MGTPGQPDGSCSPTLYGESGGGINRGRFLIHRRALIAGAIAMPMVARAAAWPPGDLLERALMAAGGRDRLARVKALSLAGTMSFGDGPPKLSVGIHCEPFGRVAVTTDILAASSRFNERTKVIDTKGGIIYDARGKRTALPRAEAVHEHHMFGIYGYMLLTHAVTRAEGGRLIAGHPDFPPIRFDVAADGTLLGADYAVVSADGKSVEDQRFVFEGRLNDKGINWPARMTIAHDTRLWLTIDFTNFSVKFN